MTTFATIPLDKITLHPDNVRRDAAADEEMVESIKSQGILQALSVVEEGDHYLLIAGHRRLDGARQAGLTAVPASILDHLTTRGQQIEAMLVENGQRVDLTPMEEAAGYEQLTFEGYKPKDIARATGRSVATVNARLQLTKLADEAKEAIHTQQITLEDAAALNALEDFPEILAKVVAAIGTTSFQSTLRNADWEVSREKKHRETRSEYEAAGLTLIEMPEDGWDFENGPVPYRGALEDGVADAWYETNDQWTGPSLARLKPEEADPDAAARKEARDSQWERERSEREARDAARAAARELRVEHYRGLFAKVKLPPAVLPVVAAALSAESINYSQDDLDLYGAVGLKRTMAQHWQDDWDLAEQIRSLKPAALATYLFGTQAASLERLVRVPRSAGEGSAALGYFDLLTASGYVLSAAEVDLVAEIKGRVVELEAEEAAA